MEDSKGGLAAPFVLAIVFTILRLTHVIDWSWWWVLSPLWISSGLICAAFLFVLILEEFS